MRSFSVQDSSAIKAPTVEFEAACRVAPVNAPRFGIAGQHRTDGQESADAHIQMIGKTGVKEALNK